MGPEESFLKVSVSLGKACWGFGFDLLKSIYFIFGKY